MPELRPPPDFPDHFSRLAAEYARFRPGYPSALFDTVARSAPRHERCWDCATGNGQAAVSLAERFEQVIATDASASQVAHARPHDRVIYRVERAEHTTLPDASVDAVTVAAALHWLDIEAFVAEVRRVARPGAVFAAWTYTTDLLAEPALETVLDTYTNEVLGPFWTPNHALVQSRYRDVTLPFEPLDAPELAVEVHWDFDHLLGALETWSAAGLYREEHDQRPTEVIRDDLAHAWQRDLPLQEPRPIRLPLALRLGRVA